MKSPLITEEFKRQVATLLFVKLPPGHPAEQRLLDRAMDKAHLPYTKAEFSDIEKLDGKFVASDISNQIYYKLRLITELLDGDLDHPNAQPILAEVMKLWPKTK